MRSSVSDGSLSDTAVGLQGLDGSHRSNKDRSPKSETPTRERERFVVSGMGKKSNSTSQLSATGMSCSPLLLPLFYQVQSFLCSKSILSINDFFEIVDKI